MLSQPCCRDFSIDDLEEKFMNLLFRRTLLSVFPIDFSLCLKKVKKTFACKNQEVYFSLYKKVVELNFMESTNYFSYPKNSHRWHS